MKKEDYMRLPKERLAELLEERDNEPRFIPYPLQNPLLIQQPQEQKTGPCFGGGECTNPFHDCVNCPRHSSGGYVTTTIGTGGKL